MLGGGLLVAAALLVAPARTRPVGAAAPCGLLAVAGGLTRRCRSSGRSSPSDAWLEANRTLAYLAAFAAGLALVRLAPRALGRPCSAAIVLAAVVVCGYALLTKVLPGSLNPDETLRAPARAVRLLERRRPDRRARRPRLPVARGAARRPRRVNALAFPALGLLLLAMLLSYSRGSLLALLSAARLWFALVPLRLRGATVLGVGALGAGLRGRSWAFAQDALTEDRVGLTERSAAGTRARRCCCVVLVAACWPPASRSASPTARRAPDEPTRAPASARPSWCCSRSCPSALVGALALSDAAWAARSPTAGRR